jgi:hypothetical protein
MPKTFHLTHQKSHAALDEAIRCLCSATSDLLGLLPEEGAQFHTLSIPGAGRVLAHESAIRAWFAGSFDEYAVFIAEHLVVHPRIGWTDLLSLSVPFRPDRLCLTLTMNPDQTAKEGAQQPLAGSMYWNWSGSRQTWDYSKPGAAEHRFHLIGSAPRVPGFTTGHRMALADLQLCERLEANAERLPWRPQLSLLETASLPVPAPPPEHQPNPVGRPKGGSSAEQTGLDQEERLTLGDPRLNDRVLAPEQEPKVFRLPDNREIVLVDWRDIEQPFGRRVQSKLAAMTQVDYLHGRIFWESREILEQYRQRGQAIPGAKIKNMWWKTQFGQVSLNAKQMIWAYWTTEVPDFVRNRTYIASEVEIGSLDGVYNMVAKGYKAGNQLEKDFFEAQRSKARALFDERKRRAQEEHRIFDETFRDPNKIWRNQNGSEAEITIRDPSYSKTLSNIHKAGSDTPDREIAKARRLPETIGEIFAKKVKKAELTAEEAYRRAIYLAFHRGGWKSNDDVENPLDEEVTFVRAWLSREENDRGKMQNALSDLHTSAASPSEIVMMKKHNYVGKVGDYSRFAEWWVSGLESTTSIIQSKFKYVLGLKPEDYGAEPVDMEALADARGRGSDE